MPGCHCLRRSRGSYRSSKTRGCRDARWCVSTCSWSADGAAACSRDTLTRKRGLSAGGMGPHRPLALDYLHAPIPLTALDRPVVYEQLARFDDAGAVIEVPFGIGDGLTTGQGSQERRLLYHATIHGHPVVGGYIGRMPPGVAQAYATMPVVGNLLRLSSGEEAIEETAASGAAIPVSGTRYRSRIAGACSTTCDRRSTSISSRQAAARSFMPCRA